MKEMKQRMLKENTWDVGRGERAKENSERQRACSALGQLGCYLHFRQEHPVQIKLPEGLIRDRINFEKN